MSAYALPNTWRFRQHSAADGTWKPTWMWHKTAYDFRTEAVKLARVYRTEGRKLPEWLQRLVK